MPSRPACLAQGRSGAAFQSEGKFDIWQRHGLWLGAEGAGEKSQDGRGRANLRRRLAGAGFPNTCSRPMERRRWVGATAQPAVPRRWRHLRCSASAELRAGDVGEGRPRPRPVELGFLSPGSLGGRCELFLGVFKAVICRLVGSGCPGLERGATGREQARGPSGLRASRDAQLGVALRTESPKYWKMEDGGNVFPGRRASRRN